MATYTKLEKIGSGGYSDVWECRREEDGAILAQKIFVHIEVGSRERFIREIKILSQLNHQNIIRTYDINVGPDPFIIMPYYKYNLKSLKGQLIFHNFAPHEAGDYFFPILKAIKYAHEKGIIHRDLHPANILFNSFEDIVVSDFGLGRQIDSLTTRITSRGEAKGVWPFAAPEQMEDLKTTSKATDVFALGVLLYYLCTGSTNPIVETVEIADRLFKIILKCVEREPTKRYKDAIELYDACLYVTTPLGMGTMGL